MPSPSGFLADVVYSGGGYSALGTGGEDGGGFSWPTASTSAARDGEEDGAKRASGGGYRPAPMLAEEEGRDLFGPGPAAGEDAAGEEQRSERESRRLKRGSQSSMSGVDDEGAEDGQEEDAGKGKRTRTR